MHAGITCNMAGDPTALATDDEDRVYPWLGYLSRGSERRPTTLSKLVWGRQVQEVNCPCFKQPELAISKGMS